MKCLTLGKGAVCAAMLLLVAGCIWGCGEAEGNKSDGALLMSQDTAAGEAEDGGTEGASDEESSNREDGDVESEAEEATGEDDYKKNAEELLADGNLFILTDLDTEAEQLTLKNLRNGKRVRYNYTLATRFLNKYNEPQSESNFLPGMVVSIEKNAENVLETVTMNGDVWIVEDLKNYSIDGERGIFTIGRTRYRLSDMTEVFANGGEASIGDIRESDVLRVVGWEKDILSVSVTTGHGYLALVNTIHFADSILSIGGKTHIRVTGDTAVELTAGEYVVTAAKDGYGGQATVEIKSNEQTVLDMELLKGDGPKKCRINFIIEAEDPRVFIDHEEVPANEETDVTYGQHRLRIIADGYEPWEKTLVVNSPTAQLELSLVKGGQTDKRAEYSGNTPAGENASGSGEPADSNNTDHTDSAENGNNSSSQAASSASSDSGSTSTGSSADSTNTGTSAADRRQAEVDYLTTLSNMISTLTGN